MLRTIDLRNQSLDDYSQVVPRGKFDVEHAIEAVRPICEAVKTRGKQALIEYSQQFDHILPKQLRVAKEDLQTTLDNLDPDLRDAIEVAISRRRQVCEQIETETIWRETELGDQARVGAKLIPVERVGLYVPGGLAPLASSVLMNVIPAQVAGVKSLAVATPPQADFGGLPHPTILAVCAMLGVDEVYAVGGAQAIAMFAYGVEDLCPKADMVTGPGNIFVVAAKRHLRGVIGIDSEAGPTEIAVIADDSADPAQVASDLISQAEHDPMAGAVLITADEKFASKVDEKIVEQLNNLATAERLKISLTGEQSAKVLVRDIDQAVAVANAYAAEHLEIQVRDGAQLAQKITNAGAIFIGNYSPVPLGDYSAGSTHVLPTGGAAKYSSGLTVRSFMKIVHFIDYSSSALAQIGKGIQLFANAEHLPGHANAIAIREAN